MTDLSRVRVTGQHAAKAGYCTNGQDRVMERYNIDPLKFYGEGYTIEEVEHIQNPMVRRVIEIAIAEYEEQVKNG